MANITYDQAKVFATLVLEGIQREYPNKITHLLNTLSDVQSPKSLHPAFYGCWDVHSSVHGFWLFIRFLRFFPNLEPAAQIRDVLNETLTKNNILKELDYFKAPNRTSFERPYGWAWILKLQSEINDYVKENPEDQDGKKWETNLKSLSQFIVEQFEIFFEKVEYPNRVGYVTYRIIFHAHVFSHFLLTFTFFFKKKCPYQHGLRPILSSRLRNHCREP